MQAVGYESTGMWPDVTAYQQEFVYGGPLPPSWVDGNQCSIPVTNSVPAGTQWREHPHTSNNSETYQSWVDFQQIIQQQGIITNVGSDWNKAAVAQQNSVQIPAVNTSLSFEKNYAANSQTMTGGDLKSSVMRRTSSMNSNDSAAAPRNNIIDVSTSAVCRPTVISICGASSGTVRDNRSSTDRLNSGESKNWMSSYAHNQSNIPHPLTTDNSNTYTADSQMYCDVTGNNNNNNSNVYSLSQMPSCNGQFYGVPYGWVQQGVYGGGQMVASKCSWSGFDDSGVSGGD